MTLPMLNSTVILSLKGRRLGTGFLLTDSGLLATCFHIVRAPHSDQAAVGQVLDFVTLSADSADALRQAVVTPYFNADCDAALLQIQGELPADLKPVTLIQGNHPAVQGVAFRLLGHAEIADPGTQYGYYSAAGQIENVLPRNRVNVLKLKSNDLHKGMSGGAIYAPDLKGVVGMQSVRINPDPKNGAWGKDTGFACLSEAITALSPVPIPLQAPSITPPCAPTRIQNISSQTIQELGAINAQTINVQTVTIAEAGLTENWHRPDEIGHRWQKEIPRETQLRALREKFTHSPSRSAAIALWGMAGSGKSTLAAQYADRYAQDYPGGILWADLGANFDPQQGTKEIFTRWANWGYGGSQQLTQRLGQKRVDILPEDIQRLFSRNGKMLVVLDDIQRAEQLAPFLEALPSKADLLVTMPTQQSLQEATTITPQLYPVQGLPPEDAIAFLKSSLPELADSLLADLASTFDYHTQALVIVATELQNSTRPEKTAQQLLQRQNNAALEPIYTAFDFSYQQLSQTRDRQCFQQLGILNRVRADFSTELAAALWEVAPEAAQNTLEILQQRTLVVQLENRRWSLNRLAYDYAYDRLKAQNPDLEHPTRDRYIQFVFNLATVGHAWADGQIKSALDSQLEMPHLRHVGHLLVERLAEDYPLTPPFDLDSLETPTAQDLPTERRSQIEATGVYLISASQYLMQPEAQGFAVRWLAALITAAQVLKEPVGVALGCFLLGQRYLYDGRQEALDDAVHLFHRAHQLWQRTGDLQSAGYALNGKGNTLRLQGNTQAAIETFAVALTELESAGYEDAQLQATLMMSLSGQYLTINEFDQTRHYLEQATALTDEKLSDDFAFEIVKQFSLLLLNLGQPQEAMDRLQQARNRAVQVCNEQTIAEISVLIGLTHVNLGESEVASGIFQSLLNQTDKPLHARLRSPALSGLASVHLNQGDFQAARACLEEALELLEKYPDRSQEAQVLALLGEVKFSMHQPEIALEHLQQALPMLEAVQDTTTAVRILYGIGSIYQKTDRISEGLDYLKEILPTIQNLNNVGAEVAVLNWVAILLSDVGDIAQAITYFDQAEPIIEKIENDIELATIFTLTAKLYRLIGKIDRAVGTARKVVDIWRKLNNLPQLSEALILLASISFNQVQPRDIEEILLEVNTLTQADAESLARAQYYNLRGMLDLQASGQYPDRLNDAQRMFERSASINRSIQDPDISMVSLNNLALVRLNKRDFEGAQKDFEAAIEVARSQASAPQIALGLTNLAFTAYLRDGAQSKAHEHLQEAIRVMEEANITTDAGNQNIEMLRMFAKNVKQGSADALPQESLQMLLNMDSWHGLQFILQLRSESLLTEAAERILAATLEATRRRQQHALGNVLDYYGTLLYLLDRTQLEGNVPSIQVMQNEPGAEALYYWWSYQQRMKRNYGGALAHINKALEIDPHHLEALIERGWIHRGLGQISSAITDFDTAIKAQRQAASAYQGKGVVLFEQGHLNEAIAALTKAIDLAPDDASRAYSYQWRGMLYQTQTDFDAALKDLDQAVKISDQTSDHRYRRALIYLATQQLDSALQEFTIAIEIDKKNQNEEALAFDYFWRGITNDLLHDAEGARINWQEGASYQHTVPGRWSDPLYKSTAQNDPEMMLHQYQTLLDDSLYSWHVLPIHIQHQKLLARLYPQKGTYIQAQALLEQALQNRSVGGT